LTRSLSTGEIISLFIFGCDQQHLEDLLSDFKCTGHRVAHVFVDGLPTASHTRKVTWLEAPIGPLLFCQDIDFIWVCRSLCHSPVGSLANYIAYP